jgi:hypothetical protein
VRIIAAQKHAASHGALRSFGPQKTRPQDDKFYGIFAGK